MKIANHNIITSWSIFSLVKRNAIESEAELIDDLLKSAKFGNWDRVWEILGEPLSPNHSHLLNVIPQSRRWCVLHQAVFWNNAEILRRLLKYKTCDSEIRAKRCMSECGQTDKLTAFEIAQLYRHTNMSAIIGGVMLNSVLDQRIPTYHQYEGFNEDLCQSMVLITLSSYKKAFHPRPVDPNRSVFNILRDIFQDLETRPDRWKEVKDIVADSVYTVNEPKANAISECSTIHEFFSQVVNCYTDENNAIYRFLNMAFRRQMQQGYRPTGEDLAMGPYCVMYQLLLLFWGDLPQERKPTYRKMMMRPEDADQYRVGTQFVWLAVVSSAVREDHTHAFPTSGPTGDVTVIFEIDNSEPCLWQPRNIEKHATFKETERTYPAGGKFRVTQRQRVDENEIRVDLKLLPN